MSRQFSLTDGGRLRVRRPESLVGRCAGTLRLGARARLAVTGAAALFAVAASSGVSAGSLAQPRDKALERQAAAYIQFRQDIAAIEAAEFTGPEVTREAHRLLSTHNANDLAAGWVAYAALIAADTPEFADSLQDEVSSRKRWKAYRLKGKDGFLAHLAQNPRYASGLKGADAAVERVLAMAVQDGARVVNLGEAFKNQAYAMQKTAWGKKQIGPSSKRLTEAEEFARARPAPIAPPFKPAEKGGVTAPALAALNGDWAPDWGETAGPGEISEKNAQVIMDRVLNLAARYATGAVNGKLVDVYARNDRSTKCLSMATLTLKQCIAATRTSYEEAFCLGEHGLNDVAGCLGWVAGDADAGAEYAERR